MKNPIQPFLDQTGVVILDGAMATELERRGADLRDPLWSAKILLEAPHLIRQVHFDYFTAGADVAISASYQASFAGFAKRSIGHQQAADLMRLSVQLAQEARDEFWSSAANRDNRMRPLVAASVGCYGASLADGSEYRGDYGLSRQKLIDFHRPRLEVLIDGGADLIACETIPCLVEGLALVELLHEFPQTPAWLSFSCRDEEHVCHGESFAECVEKTYGSEQIVAVGLNCTPPQFVDALLTSAHHVTDKPLIAYPNSGESWNAENHRWVEGDDADTDWSSAARQWCDAGARLIGGCCRTTPEVIRAIRSTHLADFLAR